MPKNFKAEPLDIHTKIVAASLRGAMRHLTIHLSTEVEITRLRTRIKEHFDQTGEKLSFTAYVVACVARVCAERPVFNSFRRGGRLITLEDVTVNVLVERAQEEQSVPESIGIQAADKKTYHQLSAELRRLAAPNTWGQASGMGFPPKSGRVDDAARG
jgi:pyruvate/2-oxoglutarate dehydrogenase complex dihydrolipoamide acyltransferase (E2) component